MGEDPMEADATTPDDTRLWVAESLVEVRKLEDPRGQSTSSETKAEPAEAA